MNTRKYSNYQGKKTAVKSIVISIIFGMILGLTAKLVDVPEITGVLPIFDNILGRFGVWIFAAALLAVFSSTPMYAALKVFSFFLSMLLTYYTYTVLFLGFYPKSQIILWSIVSLISPVCAVIMWHAHENSWIANILAALPCAALCTEWYITGSENILLLIVYICMIICLLICIPSNKKQCLFTFLVAAAMSVILIRTGLLHYIYGELLNI